MGFATKKNDPWIAEQTARFFFADDSNARTKEGVPQDIQQFQEYLNAQDACTEFPEFAFCVIRAAMLLRGLAGHLGMHVDAAQAWLPYAHKCLRDTEGQQ